MKLRHKEDKRSDHFPAKQPRLVGNEITNGQAPKRFATNQSQQEPGTSNRRIFVEHQDEEDDNDGNNIAKQDPMKLLV